MSEKCRSTSASAIQVKQWLKTVSIDGKLDVIVDIFRNVIFTHIIICTIRDNADTITDSTKSGKVFVYQDYHNAIRITVPKLGM
jgi:hypothetical protein